MSWLLMYNSMRCRCIVFVLCLAVAYAPLHGAIADVSGLGKVATGTSIAVVPVYDGVADKKSEEIAHAITEALSLSTSFYVVEQDKTKDILRYYHQVHQPEGVSVLNEQLELAKQAYLDFDYDDARYYVEKALELWNRHQELVFTDGQTLIDTYMMAALIYKAVDDTDKTRDVFRRLLFLDPDYYVDRQSFAPSIVQIFSETRAELKEMPTGAVHVETDPKVAEVYINGVQKGVTPVTIGGLPEGRHYLLIRTNRYTAVKEEIDIKAGQTVHVQKRLVWLKKEESPAIYSIFHSREQAREQISNGVSIAKILGVDKTVMVDVDEEARKGEVAVRMVDRRYRAGHVPIRIRYSTKRGVGEDDLARMTATLAEQATQDLLASPRKYVEPDYIGDPVLLGKRVPKFLKSPITWGAVGLIVVGAITGGTAAALSTSKSKPKSGSVTINFR